MLLIDITAFALGKAYCTLVIFSKMLVGNDVPLYVSGLKRKKPRRP